MSIQHVYTSGEKPKGHYAPAVIHQNTVYVSGQLPIDSNGHPNTGSFTEQTRLCMQNLETVLLAAGSDLQHILKVSVFLSDINNWPEFNTIFREFLGEHRPARIVVPSGILHYGCAIEIDCIAAVKTD